VEQEAAGRTTGLNAALALHREVLEAREVAADGRELSGKLLGEVRRGYVQVVPREQLRPAVRREASANGLHVGYQCHGRSFL
jgi:hypothetical protein